MLRAPGSATRSRAFLLLGQVWSRVRKAASADVRRGSERGLEATEDAFKSGHERHIHIFHQCVRHRGRRGS